MKGDFSRSTFRRKKHYDGVRLQQGRVLLDSEANELVDVQNHLRTITARDLIGPAGAPRFDDAFRVAWADGTIAFTSGRFYVDGIVCESEGETIRVTPPGTPAADVILERWPDDASLLAKDRFVEVIGRDAANARRTAMLKIGAVDPAARKLTMGNVFAGFSKLDAVRTTNTYLAQPDYLSPAHTEVVAGKTQVKAGAYLVWLDVWQRHLTHLEDPSIREIALGGPDTTTRTKTVWQVRLEPNVTDCKTFAPKQSTGRMAARDKKPSGPPKQCEIAPQAGYRRLENQLYRVEIHTPGNKSTARFKWSRDNGSLVFPIAKAVPGHPEQLELRTIGRDDVLRLQQNDFVELIDDVKELDHKAGDILTVSVPPAESDRIVTLSGPATGIDLTKNPRLRVWQSDRTSLVGAAANQGFIPLEDGVEVRFEDGEYQVGDYWLIPARTAISDETGHVEWPQDGAGNALSLPAEGIVRHFAPLATIDATGKVTHDCRPLFSPITSPDLFYLAGDGQEIALADPKLPQRLEVLVSNGAPVAGAKVEFKITSGGGSLRNADDSAALTTPVTTGADGVAACRWIAGSNLAQRQTLTARLIELESKDYVPELPPITFNAWPKFARDVIYEPGQCDFLNGTKTVQEALDKLCQRPSGGGICTLVLSQEMDWRKAILDLPPDRDAEICFRVGVFELAEQLVLKGPRRFTFTGTGEGSRIVASGLTDAIVVTDSDAVVIRDLAIESGRVGPETISINLPGVVTLRGCRSVLVEDVAFRCAGGDASGIACLSTFQCEEVRVVRCDFGVGSSQNGFLANGCSIVQVESSRFRGPVRGFRLTPELRRDVFGRLTFGTPTTANNVVVTLGDQRIAFTVPQNEVQEWQRLPEHIALEFGPNVNLTGREAVDRVLTQFTERVATSGFLMERMPNAGRRVRDIAARAVTTRAHAAVIVVTSADSLTLRDNVIQGFARGILAGAHYADSRRQLLPLNRVFIVDNTIELTFPPTATELEHGIDIGSNTHLTVRGNYVETSQLNDIARIHGFFVEGAMGGLAILRDNQVHRCATAFHAQGTNLSPAGAPTGRWLCADNVGFQVFILFSQPTNFDKDNTVQRP